MTQGQWIALAVGAVLVFWMVGAYNRLVALRTAIGGAMAQLVDLVHRRAASAAALHDAVRDAMAAEHSALEAWAQAQTQVRQAADALRAKPVMSNLASTLVAEEAALAAATSRVLALLEQHRELPSDAEVAVHLAALREVESRLGFARTLFNEAAQTYNQAVREWPTRLLARLFGFGTAGRI